MQLSDTRVTKIPITEKLREGIVETRLGVGKSAGTVGAHLGRSQSWVAQIENGRKQKISGYDLVSLFSFMLSIPREDALSQLRSKYFPQDISEAGIGAGVPSGAAFPDDAVGVGTASLVVAGSGATSASPVATGTGAGATSVDTLGAGATSAGPVAAGAADAATRVGTGAWPHLAPSAAHATHYDAASNTGTDGHATGTGPTEPGPDTSTPPIPGTHGTPAGHSDWAATMPASAPFAAAPSPAGQSAAGLPSAPPATPESGDGDAGSAPLPYTMPRFDTSGFGGMGTDPSAGAVGSPAAADSLLSGKLRHFCARIQSEYALADTGRRSLILSGLDRAAEHFLARFAPIGDDGVETEIINIRDLTDEEYNRLLMTKPLVGGVYRVPVAAFSALSPQIDRFDHQGFILCGIIENDLDKPSVASCVIIPILPTLDKDHLPSHCSFRLLGAHYSAIGELCTTLENSHLTQLIAFSSVEEYTNMVFAIAHASAELLPVPVPQLIAKCKPYFQHVMKHQKRLLRM